MKLTPIERETILNLNESEDTASLYTYNEKLQKRFDKLAEKHPELVSRTTSSCGAVTYDFPKKMLTVSIREPLNNAELQRRKEYGTQHGIHTRTRQ